MDLDYLKNENRIPRKYKRSDGIVKWDKVPTAIENDSSENPLRSIYPEEQTTQKIYQSELPENLVRPSGMSCVF